MSYLNPDRDRAVALVYTTLVALYLTGEEAAAAYLMGQLSGELLGQVSVLASRDIATGMAHALRAHAEPGPDTPPVSWQPDDVDDELAYDELSEEEQDEGDRYENTPGTKKVDEFDHDPVVVDGVAYVVRELAWNGGGKSFDVVRVADDEVLTMDESLDVHPDEQAVRRVVEAYREDAGSPV